MTERPAAARRGRHTATKTSSGKIGGAFIVVEPRGGPIDPLLLDSHVAVDVTERAIASEVEHPAAGLDPAPLVGAFGNLADQVGLARDHLDGSTQFCLEGFRGRHRCDYPIPMNQCLAGLPARSLVEAEHVVRSALPLATHRTRHVVLSRAVPLDGLHVIGQLDLTILARLVGRSHTLTARRVCDGY